MIAAGLLGAAGLAAVAATTATSDHGRRDARDVDPTTHRRRRSRRRGTGGRRRRRSATATAACGSQQIGDFDQPVYVTQPPSGDDDHLYVVEQCGHDPAGPGRRRRADRVPRRSATWSPAAASRACSRSPSPPTTRESGLLYVNYTDTDGRLADGRVPALGRRPRRRRSGQRPGAAARSTTSPPTTTAACCMFGPDGELYLGMGDGGGAGDPERTAQDPDSPLGKLLRIDRRAAAATRSRRSGCATRGATRSTARPDELWIGDVGQDTFEEIDAVASSELGRGPLNFGWSAFEGTAALQLRPAGARRDRPPVLDYSHDDGCSVTGGYVVRDPRARVPLRPLPLRRLLRRRAAQLPRRRRGRRAGTTARSGSQVAQLSSFGEDADGHVYAISLDGPVYRLEPDSG